MPEFQQKKKEETKSEETVTQEFPVEEKDSTELLNDIDDLLDEIDGVLEENAEEFVNNYIQKGGQ